MVIRCCVTVDLKLGVKTKVLWVNTVQRNVMYDDTKTDASG